MYLILIYFPFREGGGLRSIIGKKNSLSLDVVILVLNDACTAINSSRAFNTLCLVSADTIYNYCEDAAGENLEKLADRDARGVIGGSGDYR